MEIIELRYALQDKFSGLYVAQQAKALTKEIDSALLYSLSDIKETKARQESPERYEIIEVHKITSVEFIAARKIENE